MISWTGAGVSTSTGIPDFRGPNGKWTLAARKKQRDPSLKVVNSIQAFPSPTHLAIVGLLRAGYLKKLISSNCDGLHRRSGVMAPEIAELHGNGNKARCNKCHKFALLDDRVRVAAKSKEHGTNQPCPYGDCKGEMEDTIINFGEYLLPEVSRDANSKADLLLGLGSSFRVITCDALEDVPKNGGNVVIVNLQITPYDDICALRIFATCDEVMDALMKKLELPIPDWELHRWVKVTRDATGNLTVQGVDEEGNNYGWIMKAQAANVEVDPANGRKKLVVSAEADLDTMKCFHPLQIPCSEGKPAEQLVLHCIGHRGEPPAFIPCPAGTGKASQLHRLMLPIRRGEGPASEWKILQ